MPRDRDPCMPPGEDQLELPVVLGWFVECCTRLRQGLLALRDFPPRARPPARFCPCRGPLVSR